MVNVAVYVVPEPMKPDSEAPPETLTSEALKLVDGLLSVKVMTSVAPSNKSPARRV